MQYSNFATFGLGALGNNDNRKLGARFIALDDFFTQQVDVVWDFGNQDDIRPTRQA